MIILRQKIFVDVDNLASYYDEDGNLKPFPNDEDRRKHDTFKKKLEELKDKKDEESQKKYREYKEFIENGNRKNPKNNSSSSNSSYDYGGEYGSGSRDKRVDDYYKSVRRANGITWGTWGASIGNTMIRDDVRNKRKEKIDEKIGRDKRMKKSDRAEINKFKSKSSRSKKYLQDAVDENKTQEERKKAARKYIRRESINKASDFAIGGANIGANLGNLGGRFVATNKLATGRLKTDDRSIMKGTLGGLASGAAIGATIGGIRSARVSKRDIEKLRNSQDKNNKSKDKIRVARGEMTESNFVEKHGGKE